MTRHTLADRILHRFALQSRGFRKFCFNRECDRNGSALDYDRENVFITGMARSGSTVLLNQIYTGNEFAATTYALMPFVMAPALSGSIRGIPRSTVTATERRHGDSISIDLNSAEALDGVFWESYMPQIQDYLHPREVPPEILDRYAMFIENLLLFSRKNRYLSKMNQGIPVLGSLASRFNRSTFLVPFRDPLQQASSLLRQHLHFSQLSNYEQNYLGWLGHHEFGDTHLGFYQNSDKPNSGLSQEGLNYWLGQWHNGYSWLTQLIGLHSNIYPLAYEKMSESQSFRDSLAGRINTTLPAEAFINANKAELKPDTDIDPSLYAACQLLYAQLCEHCETRLCS